MINKKAQGLEMSTIILAVLGLVILLILFAVLTGKLQWFGKGLTTCAGECTTEATCTNINNGYNLGGQFLDPDPNKKGSTCAYDNPGSNNPGERSLICCSSKKLIP